MVPSDERLQFLIDSELGVLARASARDIGAPAVEDLAAALNRKKIVIGGIVHFAAEGVESGHAVALVLGQEHEGEREIRRAAAGDGAAFLHGSTFVNR